MKTNKQKNTEHDQRVRPKQPVYDFKPLEAVMREWAKNV